MNVFLIQARGIDPIHRIISDIGVEIVIAHVSYGIGLQKPPQARIIHPGLVVVERDFRQRGLAGVAEARAAPTRRLAGGAPYPKNQFATPIAYCGFG
jgi:hypothetical protein